MPSLEKPTADAKGRIRYDDAIAYLAQKFDFSPNDFNDTHGCYARWCQKHGKRKTPPAIEDQQRQWREYCAADDGEKAEPPYQNFWHWLLNVVRPVGGKPPSFFKLDIPTLLSTYDQTYAILERTLQEAAATKIQAALQLVPPELREAAQRQYAPKPTELQPFARTILGHFQAEFGDVIKLDLRRD